MYDYELEVRCGDAEQDDLMPAWRHISHTDPHRALVTCALLEGLPFTRLEGRKTYNWKEEETHVS